MPQPARADQESATAPGRRAGLRGLPAGYDLDRLPLSVPPALGEQPAGWLSRVAYRYGLTPHALLTTIGAPTPSYNVRAVARHLHRHTDQVTALLGTPPPPDAVTDGGCLDGALAGYQATYAGGVGRWPSGSRFCPACLTGPGQSGQSGQAGAGRVAGVWSASWACPLQVVCLTHWVVLVSCCPRCGQVPWSSPAWTARCGPGWICPEHLPSPPRPPGQLAASAGEGRAGRRTGCGQDLRAVPASPAGDRDVQVQQLLLHAVRRAAQDPDGVTSACAVEATHEQYLHALLELVVEHRGSVAGLWRLGRDPRLLLDSLGVAVAVLTEPDPPAAVRLAERHGLLSPAGRCTRPVRTAPCAGARTAPCSPRSGSVSCTTLAACRPPGS